MTRLLIRLFVKNAEYVSDPAVRGAYGALSGAVGLCTNLLLAAVKIMTGALISSIAILADGVNNLADGVSSVVTLAGFKMSGKPSDKDHPFGHARYEYIAGLVISILIIIFGIQLVQASAQKIMSPALPQYSPVAVGLLIAAILIKLWQCLFYRFVGTRIKSSTVKAAGVDSRNDAITTTAVLVSLIGGRLTGLLLLDGIMGVCVGLFILYSGINLVRETISPLLGLAPDRELVEALEEKILSYDGVLGLHDLVVHEYGQGRIFATVHLEVSSGENIMQSHDLIDDIEHEIGRNMNMNLVIHMDPVDSTDEKTLLLKEKVTAIIKEVDETLNFHDFRVVHGKTHTNILFDVVLPATSKQEKEDLQNLLAAKIRAMSDEETYYAVITVDRNYA